MKSRILFVCMMAIGLTAIWAFTPPQEKKKGEPWNIPAEYKAKENTFKGDADLLRLGKATYAKHCRACHGNAGEGDGPKARNLEFHPGDFSDATWQASVTDGEVYYMSIIGRDEMPNYEGKITDEEERWALVNYVRSLQK
ncbi:MAG: cytochrome c [Bacteroidetes bacterium]|jgi:mono/diheme cytochrome c family protein|nr:cytochrome c [Bacteroidota bacterium]